MSTNMENYLGETVQTTDNSRLKVSGTAEEFQKFISTLFENNGVLHDLRARLRGHIVTVLRSVENGIPPETQRHITQRLELKFQSLNVLIAEYLMKLEFGYSFAVFISEIPLSNMVFDFTKLMFNNSLNDSIVQFSENDIWRILNYLGIKCDTEHALKLVEDYQKGEEPLLISILRHTPLFIESRQVDEDLSEDSSSAVIMYADEKASQKPSHKCKHYAYCQSCRNRIDSAKKKYKMKKKRMVQKETVSSHNSLNDDDLTRKARVVEERLIEEMFEQLKNVYEGEMDLMKIEQQKKMKQSLASHAALLKCQRDELEEEMRRRRVLMEEELQERKEFVRGLAASLREAHRQLQIEQQKLRGDADDLAMRENCLKSQLQKAEEALRSRGEEMRQQISDELLALDDQLRSMKREREAINTQREDLEHLRRVSDANIKLLTTRNIGQNEHLIGDYDSMRSELAILTKYITTANATESTDKVAEGHLKNNEQDTSDRNDDDRLKQNQVINDFKKLKNINISNSYLSKLRRDTMASCESCELALRRLRGENERLEAFAKQQGSHIELLTTALRRLDRPSMTLAHTNSYATLVGRGNDEDRGEQGVGEKLDQSATPTTAGPDRRNDGQRDPATSRRHFHQWKEIRQRVAHIDQPSREFTAFVGDGCSSSHAGISVEEPNGAVTNEDPHRTKEIHKRNVLTERCLTKIRDRKKLRKKYKEPLPTRVKSPNTMLREAKLRLRKLEIEAEAVEQSYMNFRKRRADEKKLFKEESLTRISNAHLECRIPKKHDESKIQDQTNLDYDKYYREYLKLDMCNAIHRNAANAANVKPIPYSYCEVDIQLNEEKSRANNYLETPLSELRKLYRSGNSRPMNIQAKTYVPQIVTSNPWNNELNKCKRNEKELSILKKNINNLYNLNSQETLDSNNMDTICLNNNNVELDNVNTATAVEDNCIKENKYIVAVVCSPRNEVTNLLEVEDFEVMPNTSDAPASDIFDNQLIAIQSSEGGKNVMESKSETEIEKVLFSQVIKNPKETSPVYDDTTKNSRSEKHISSIKHDSLNDTKETSLVHETSQNSRSEKHVSLSKHDSYNDNKETRPLHDTTQNSRSEKHLSKHDSYNDKPPNADDANVLNVEKSYDELDKDTDVEYADDFSADVNNYNSPSEYANNSLISIIKTSEEDNFWDS